MTEEKKDEFDYESLISEEVRSKAKRRLQYFRVMYYTIGIVFLAASVIKFRQQEIIAGFIFLALCSIVSTFGKVCESAIKNI